MRHVLKQNRTERHVYYKNVRNRTEEIKTYELQLTITKYREYINFTVKSLIVNYRLN